ncbi:MAG: hypothetical protein A2X80_12690 [Geobacteraceae bacterium GWB2_52_12]|nr:MAG: hypothetical protein A2X80_12690 [Geobacteraceae bacterium GWB2_52_12]
MDRSQFQQLKQYVGADLLNYALNRTDIDYQTDFESLTINDEQMSVLVDIHGKIQQCRLQYIAQGGYGDGADFYLRRLLHNGESIFSHYRTICGGVAESPASDDPVIAHLQRLCIRDYPNLLMKSTGGTNLPVMGGMNVGIDDYDTFIALIKDDLLNAITNGKDGLDYAFEFTTEDGLQFNTQVCTACTTLITRAFYDACNRMDYSLHSVLKTIADYIGILRELVTGNTVQYSSFVGLKGIRFAEFTEIIFDGAALRQYAGIENPGIHTQRTVVSHSDEHSRYSGHVLEAIHKTKLYSHEATCNTGNSIEANRVQQDVLEKVLFSLVFSCECTRGPTPSFFEIGFPLIGPGNCGLADQNPGEYLLIDEAAKDSVKNWFGILRDKPLDKVKTPLQRLKYAIFERRNPEDAIVDAVIAWEGMFSEAFETTFKVTGSLAKYLSGPEERTAFLSRLKKLYQLRSDLVHGANSKLLQQESVDDLRSEVVSIGLRCLKKLVSDELLLPMSPSERVKHLLILTEAQRGEVNP